jgi:O-antigen ligase
VIVGIAVARQPVLTPVVLLGLLIAAAVILRPYLAAALMIISFYFDGYLSPGGQVVTLGKLVGMLALVAWFLAWGVGRLKLVVTPHLLCLAGMAGWLAVATLPAQNRKVALITDGRYAAFFLVFFLVTQIVQHRWDRVRGLTSIAVLASAASASIGLAGFFIGAVHRASGPLSGANDFGFLLSSTLPAAAWYARSAPTKAGRAMYSGATCLLLVTILATLSRSAIVAVIAMGVWAAVTRRVPLRWLALGVCGLAACVVVALVHPPAVLHSDLARREKVANQNVQSRLYYWNIATKEAAVSPLVGVGPGNFQTNFGSVGTVYNLTKGYQTTHDAYLNILAELGFPGLGLFLAFLGFSWRDLRAPPGEGEDAGLRAAVAMGFVAAMVGSLFLTEQYYAPIWLLPALVAAPLGYRARRSKPASISTPHLAPL